MVMEKTTKQEILKWVKFVAFAVLIIGGLNYLLMGLFGFDLIGGMLGGRGTVASRVFYSLFGLGAATLLAIVLVKVFSKDERVNKRKTSA